MNTKPIPSILSLREVCDLTGLSESTVRRALRGGLLQGSRLGSRKIRFSGEDIQRWLSSTSTTSTETKKGAK